MEKLILCYPQTAVHGELYYLFSHRTDTSPGGPIYFFHWILDTTELHSPFYGLIPILIVPDSYRKSCFFQASYSFQLFMYGFVEDPPGTTRVFSSAAPSTWTTSHNYLIDSFPLRSKPLQKYFFLSFSNIHNVLHLLDVFCSTQVRLKPASHSKADFIVSLYTYVLSNLERVARRMLHKEDCKSEVGINAIPSSSIKKYS